MAGGAIAVALAAWTTTAWAGPEAQRRKYDLPPFTHEAGHTVEATVRTRDDVPLATRVLLPEGDGPWPVIFTRTPYPMGRYLDGRCEVFVRYGYACGWQYVRGQGASGGLWHPFDHEHDDGLDTLAWLAEQPWNDGNVALLGESYMAAVQWAVADDLPDQVKTLVPTVFGADAYRAAYEGGMFRHEVTTAWMALMPDRGMRFFSGGRFQKALRTRPRLDMDVAASGREIPWFDTWLRSDVTSAPYWSRPEVAAVSASPEVLDVPVLMLAGWSDAFLGNQLDSWARLASAERSTLVVGPWNHIGRVAADHRLDGVDEGAGLDGTLAQTRRLLDWFDHHLRGAPATLPVGRALTYVVGDGRWAERAAWPPPTHDVTFRLGDGDASACAATLGSTAGDEPVRFAYDPEDPAPSAGGAGILAGVLPFFGGTKPGFRDARRLCPRRDDVVGFTSDPLEAPLHLAGSPRAVLSVASSAEDTAFVLRVSDVTPEGRVVVVRETIRSLSLREGDAARVPYTPGEAVVLPLEAWPVEYVFQPGHRVRVEISSSAFPKYEAHPNVAGPWASAAATVPADQTVFPAGSTVVLPVAVEAGGGGSVAP